MKIAVVGTILFLLLLQPVSYAEDQEEVRVITGKLSGYGYQAVVVDAQKIKLCDEYEVLDTLDNPISIDGLIATEIVTVTIKGTCAILVKAEQVRR